MTNPNLVLPLLAVGLAALSLMSCQGGKAERASEVAPSAVPDATPVSASPASVDSDVATATFALG